MAVSYKPLHHIPFQAVLRFLEYVSVSSEAEIPTN